jgi:predicted PurR-regulated permease PerM
MLRAAAKNALMKSRAMSRAMSTPLPEPAAEEEHSSAQPSGDPMVRYAVIGIFLIMATAALSIARSVALPVVAGAIFGLVLGPLVDRMVRHNIPQGLAAGLLVGTGTLLMALMVTIFAAPFAIWSDRLPGYVMAIKDRLSWVMAYARQIEGVAGQLSTTAETKVAVADGSPLVSLAMGSGAAAGGILIFVATIYFYLATRRHLKAHALRLCLGGTARRSAGALFEDIESKVATYFGVVTLINLGVGLLAGLLAWFSGMPLPLLWGAAGFVLNYIAFIGPLIMTGLLFGAGLLEEGYLATAVLPAVVFFVVHLVEGNVVTPMLVGRRLTISPFLVFISFVFWLWLWGPVGAILSTPILLVASLSLDALAEYQRAETAASDTAAV